MRALRDNPIGLHFAGHGFINSRNLYGVGALANRSWEANKDKGDILMFENEEGASDFFYEHNLREVFKKFARDEMQKSSTVKLGECDNLVDEQSDMAES